MTCKFRDITHTTVNHHPGPAIACCGSTEIAAATHRRSWIGRLLGIRPLHWVGTRSYGLYLYHWPIYQIIREPGQQLSMRQFLTALLIALPITELSYRLVELPGIQFGKRLTDKVAPRAQARGSADAVDVT